MESSKAYRSTTTGDRGFMLERGGKKVIRLDRGSQVIEREYKKDEWVEESEHRPLLPMQVTRMFFEVEKHMLIALGDTAARREMDWEMMTNRTRTAYMEEMGETDNVLVKKLHRAMHKILDPLSQ